MICVGELVADATVFRTTIGTAVLAPANKVHKAPTRHFLPIHLPTRRGCAPGFTGPAEGRRLVRNLGPISGISSQFFRGETGCRTVRSHLVPPSWLSPGMLTSRPTNVHAVVLRPRHDPSSPRCEKSTCNTRPDVPRGARRLLVLCASPRAGRRHANVPGCPQVAIPTTLSSVPCPGRALGNTCRRASSTTRERLP